VGEPRKVLTKTRPLCRCRVGQWLPRGIAWVDLICRRVVLRLEHVPFKGYCIRSVRPHGGGPADTLFVFPRPEFSVKRIELGKQPSDGAAHHLAAIESNVLGGLPNLVSHCCVTRYEDGSARRPGWWTVKTMGAAWVVQVKDPDAAASLQATSGTLDDALALADLLLGSGDAPWEPDAFLKKNKKA